MSSFSHFTTLMLVHGCLAKNFSQNVVLKCYNAWEWL
jgi:hypothetical protein